MLKELRAHHRTVLQMKFSGFSNISIAEKTGMSKENVSLIVNSELGKAYIDGLHDRSREALLDVRKELVSLNKGAIETFKRLIDPKTKAPHAVQYNTAKDILDRNGYKAPDKHIIDMTLSTKTDEELDAEINALESSINRVNNITEVTDKAVKKIPELKKIPEIKNLPITQIIEKPSEIDISDYNFFQNDEESQNLINSLPEDLLTNFEQ